jgi:hypothetical protein
MNTIAKHRVVSVAGVPEDLERRIGMAAKLLAGSGMEVVLAPWDGSRRALLVAGLDDAWGQAAASVARRRGDCVLGVAANAPAESAGFPVVSPSIQVADLTRALRGLLERRAATPAGAQIAAAGPAPQSVGGMLAAWVPAWRTNDDFAISADAVTLVVRRMGGRVFAAQADDFAAARAAFVRSAWTTRGASAGDLALGQSCGIDEFLVTACLAHAQRLPVVRGDCRLEAWPDLGAMHDVEDAMRMASVLSKRPLSVTELASRCGVSPERANAFVWAVRAAGLLAREPDVVVTSSPISVAARAVVTRLARRFGLRFGTA